MARVAYLSREDVPPSLRHLVDEITAKRGRLARPFAALLHSPEAAARVASVGSYVRFEAGLDAWVRELAILATARANGSQYEFTHHVDLARQAGVREEAIVALRQGAAPEALESEESLAVRYVQELLHDRKISDATYIAAQERFGLKALVNLTVLVGYYTMLAYVMHALEVELEPDVAPLLPS